MDNDRLKHSYAVANKMVELGKEKNLLDEQLQYINCFKIINELKGDNYE